MELLRYSRVAEIQRLKRAHLRSKILELLADGQRRRCKDIAEALGIESVNSCNRILTGLYESGQVCRSEDADPREKHGVQVAWFYREGGSND